MEKPDHKTARRRSLAWLATGIICLSIGVLGVRAIQKRRKSPRLQVALSFEPWHASWLAAAGSEPTKGENGRPPNAAPAPESARAPGSLVVVGIVILSAVTLLIALTLRYDRRYKAKKGQLPHLVNVCPNCGCQLPGSPLYCKRCGGGS
jgi:hypothetical protein